MSANDYYGAGKPTGPQQYPPPQGQYYPQGPPQGGYYPPQEPQQAYQGGYYQQPQQPGYQPQPQPQTVIIQQPADKGSSSGCMACLAGICLCCCAEEICDCIF